MNQFQEIADLKALDIKEYHRSFVSGDPNADRLIVEYYFNKDSGHLYAKIRFGKYAQGPPNHVHGGAIAAAFDEAMGATAWANGYPALSCSIQVEFLCPLKLDSEVLLDAWIGKCVARKVWIYAGIWDHAGTLYAEAIGLYIKQTKERFREMGDIPESLFEGLKDVD